MAVDGVNGANNNAGIYAAGAALVGGAGGAAAGWYSKPFLKDDAPTDTFAKKIAKAANDAMPQEIKDYLNPIKELNEKMLNSKTMEEYKNFNLEIVKTALKAYPDVDTAKEYMLIGDEIISNFGKTDAQVLREIESAETFDDIIAAAKSSIDRECDGKNLADLLSSGKAKAAEIEKSAVKATFESLWDSDKKKFVNPDADDELMTKVFKSVKKAAEGIQGKTAAIYGGIAAAVLGFATYLIANNKKSE